LVEIDGVDFVAGLHIDFEGADFLLIHRELGDIVDRSCFGDLFEFQRDALAGQVFHCACDIGDQRLAGLDH
jgi:hypothetical protein